jgi:hypothetical protein
MASTGFSGKRGTVKIGATALAGVEVVGWEFEPKDGVPAYCSNATAGFKTRISGVRDSSGKIEVEKLDALVLHPSRRNLIQAFKERLSLRSAVSINDADDDVHVFPAKRAARFEH